MVKNILLKDYTIVVISVRNYPNMLRNNPHPIWLVRNVAVYLWYGKQDIHPDPDL
jgi:hypothetical protein